MDAQAGVGGVCEDWDHRTQVPWTGTGRLGRGNRHQLLGALAGRYQH